MEHRIGETGLLPFRTGRVFNVDTQWYFAIRDGRDCGPFDTQQDATSELSLFLNDFEVKKSR